MKVCEDVAERWRPVPGLQGFYEVSDLGRVRSVDRVITARDGQVRRYRSVVLKTTPVPTGHRTVNLQALGRRTTTQVHRLVASAFLGPRPEGTEVRHLDGDPTNNSLSNLVYGTRSENLFDRIRHGRHHNACKTHCVRGHEFTLENTVLRPGGGRRCRACATEQQRVRSRQRQAQASSTVPVYFPETGTAGTPAAGACVVCGPRGQVRVVSVRGPIGEDVACPACTRFGARWLREEIALRWPAPGGAA